MLRNGLPLIFLSACLLGASATRADEVGYIDCTNHPDDTQVAAKAAKTQDVVGALPCGERFTILQSGFFFSRIQTKEGKVGYVYTNLISHDYSGNGVPQQQVQAVQAPAKMAARSSNPLSAIAAAFKPKSSAPAESLRVPPPSTPAAAAKPAATQTTAAVVQPAVNPRVTPPVKSPPAQAPSGPAQPAATQEPAATSAFPPKSGIIVLNETPATAESQTKPVQDATPRSVTAKVGENFTAKSGVVVQSDTPTAAQAQPKPVQTAAVKAPVATDNFSAKSAVVVQNERTAAPQPEPMPSQPAPAYVAADVNPPAVSVRLEPEPIPAQPQPAADFRAETPTPAMQKTGGGGRLHIPAIEFFGGYSFARLNSGAGSFTNYSGGMGAVALNLTHWLQVTGDSSYNMIQSSGTKVVLYGNHYGPRLFWNRRNRWSIKPFVEGLFGGSRVDTTVSGTGGYSASIRAFSMKVGGGLDIRPSRHLEVRLFDADYYRTSFPGGTTPYQTNYWISTGLVLRLFGGASE